MYVHVPVVNPLDAEEWFEVRVDVRYDVDYEVRDVDDGYVVAVDLTSVRAPSGLDVLAMLDSESVRRIEDAVVEYRRDEPYEEHDWTREREYYECW